MAKLPAITLKAARKLRHVKLSMTTKLHVVVGRVKTRYGPNHQFPCFDGIKLYMRLHILCQNFLPQSQSEVTRKRILNLADHMLCCQKFVPQQDVVSKVPTAGGTCVSKLPTAEHFWCDLETTAICKILANFIAKTVQSEQFGHVI